MDKRAKTKQKQNLKTAQENQRAKGEVAVDMTHLPHTVEHSWAFSHVSTQAFPHVYMAWIAYRCMHSHTPIHMHKLPEDLSVPQMIFTRVRSL